MKVIIISAIADDEVYFTTQNILTSNWIKIVRDFHKAARFHYQFSEIPQSLTQLTLKPLGVYIRNVNRDVKRGTASCAKINRSCYWHSWRYSYRASSHSSKIIWSLIAYSGGYIPSFLFCSSRLYHNESIKNHEIFLIILSGSFGLIGLTLGITVMLINMISTTTFGVPYIAPFAPFK